MYVVIWSLVACLVLLNLFSNVREKATEYGEFQLPAIHHPLFRELQQVDEENIQIPPPRGKRSPRAEKRRPKRATTLVDEFLNEESQLRHIFFPGQESAIDPMKDNVDDSYYYHPGRIWLDTDGNPINAHGGGILFDKISRTYYWYGEYKDGPTYQSPQYGISRVCHNLQNNVF